MIRADFDEPLPSQIAGKQKPAHPLPPTLARPNPQRQRGRVQGIDDSAFFEPLGDAEFTPTDKQSNPRRGTTFDDFLRAEDTFDETHAKPQERARNEQIDDRLHGD